jgi:hypothetical protein
VRIIGGNARNCNSTKVFYSCKSCQHAQSYSLLMAFSLLFSPHFARSFSPPGHGQLEIESPNCYPGCIRGRRATPNSQVSVHCDGRIASKRRARRYFRQNYRAEPLRLLCANARSLRKGHSRLSQNLFKWKVLRNPWDRRLCSSRKRPRCPLSECKPALCARSETVAHRGGSLKIWQEGLTSSSQFAIY